MKAVASSLTVKQVTASVYTRGRLRWRTASGAPSISRSSCLPHAGSACVQHGLVSPAPACPTPTHSRGFKGRGRFHQGRARQEEAATLWSPGMRTPGIVAAALVLVLVLQTPAVAVVSAAASARLDTACGDQKRPHQGRDSLALALPRPWPRTLSLTPALSRHAPKELLCIHGCAAPAAALLGSHVLGCAK